MKEQSSKPIDASRAAVFCTALVDSDPRRYQSWIDYYTHFFTGENIDLYLYNDGPVKVSLDLKGAQLITFSEALGRQNVCVFPGWKRSFSTALQQLGGRYRFLAHVESDTILLKWARNDFLGSLRRSGYSTGYCDSYGFIEAALQIINAPRARRFFAERYADLASFYQYENFEKVVQYALRPKLLMHGPRVEDASIDLRESYPYLSQMPIYEFYKRYPDGEIPWITPPRRPSRKDQMHLEIMRLRWAVRHMTRTDIQER